MNGIAELVDQVADGLSQLRQLLDDPSALPLSTITRDIARLERAMDKKAYVDAAFAQACVLADAGKLVGANMSVPTGSPAVYPTTLVVNGAITFD